jgi:hypothetical protein
MVCAMSAAAARRVTTLDTFLLARGTRGPVGGHA